MKMCANTVGFRSLACSYMTKKRARGRLRAVSAIMRGQCYTTIAGGIFCQIWDMEGQESERSRGVT